MRRSSRIAVMTACAAAALFTSARTARADDTSDLQGLLNETVVTTASKSAETSDVAPAMSTNISAEDLRRYGVHSLDEAIDFLSLGVVTSNPLHQVDIGARGVTLSADQGNHFLLLVNGHSVNEPLFGTARFDRGAGVPLEMIDHVEVIVGPGSVLYGSNAMLGVINIITKRAKDLEGGRVAAESEIGKSYRAAGMVGHAFTLFGSPSEVTLGVEYYEQRGPTFSFGPQVGGIDRASGQQTIYTRDTSGDVLPAGTWGGRATRGYYSKVPSAVLRFATGDFEVNVKATTYQRATPYRSRFTNSVPDFNDPDSYEIDRSLWADVRYKKTLSPIVDITARAYGDTFDYQDIQNASYVGGCLFENVQTCRYHVVGASKWVGVEAQASFDWLKDDSFVTLVGADSRARWIASKTDSVDYTTRRPLASSTGLVDENDKLLGAYLQQTWQPTRWLNLNGGARLDEETRYRGNVSPRFAVSAQTWKGGTLKAIYATGFRAPTYAETNFVNALEIRSRNLQPESVRSVEASVEQRFGAHRLRVGAFRSWWDNLVELHILTQQEQAEAAQRGEIDLLRSFGIVQYRNVSSIDNYGFDFGYEGQHGDTGQLRWGLNFTGSIARRTQGSLLQPLAVAPQAFGNARVSYDLPGELPTLAFAGHYMATRAADRAFDGGWPSLPYAPPQLELRATISGPVPARIVKGLSYRVSGNYAFASHAPYVVGPKQYAPWGDQNSTTAELAPVDQLRFTVGLQYDLSP